MPDDSPEVPLLDDIQVLYHLHRLESNALLNVVGVAMELIYAAEEKANASTTLGTLNVALTMGLWELGYLNPPPSSDPDAMIGLR